MGDIFLKLLNMSITAGWFILAVIGVRLVFRKMPKWVNCLLWGAVAIRLICPFSIESRFSVLPSTEPIRSSTVVEGEVQHYIPSIDSHLTIVENTINPMLTESFAYDEAESVAPLQVLTQAAGIVWIGGLILAILYAMASMVRLRVLVREAVRVRDNIYICDAVRTPFVLGIVRPRVYLPSDRSGKDMDYIIAHELAHLKRKDHWWKPLGYLLLGVHWFNPLCWAAYVMLCRDIELACDEKVAKDLTLPERKEYSEVLLSYALQRRMVMVCPLAFGEVGVKVRIKSVLRYKKPQFWMVAAAIAGCAAVAVCFLTNPLNQVSAQEAGPLDNGDPESTTSLTFQPSQDTKPSLPDYVCSGTYYKLEITPAVYDADAIMDYLMPEIDRSRAQKEKRGGYSVEADNVKHTWGTFAWDSGFYNFSYLRDADLSRTLTEQEALACSDAFIKHMGYQVAGNPAFEQREDAPCSAYYYFEYEGVPILGDISYNMGKNEFAYGEYIEVTMDGSGIMRVFLSHLYDVGAVLAEYPAEELIGRDQLENIVNPELKTRTRIRHHKSGFRVDEIKLVYLPWQEGRTWVLRPAFCVRYTSLQDGKVTSESGIMLVDAVSGDVYK